MYCESCRQVFFLTYEPWSMERLSLTLSIKALEYARHHTSTFSASQPRVQKQPSVIGGTGRKIDRVINWHCSLKRNPSFSTKIRKYFIRYDLLRGICYIIICPMVSSLMLHTPQRNLHAWHWDDEMTLAGSSWDSISIQFGYSLAIAIKCWTFSFLSMVVLRGKRNKHH